MEIICIKTESVFFPSEKFYIKIDLSKYKKSIKGNIGVVFKKESGELSDIGVMGRIEGNEIISSYRNNEKVTYSTILLQGSKRIKIKSTKEIGEPDSVVFLATVEVLEDEIITSESKKILEDEKIVEKLKSTIIQYLNPSQKQDNTQVLIERINNYTNYIKLNFQICASLPIPALEKQKLLEINDIVLRMKTTIEILESLIKIKHQNIDTSIMPRSEKFDSTAIQNFKNKSNPKFDSVSKIEELLKTKKLSEEAKTIATNEVKRLKSMDPRMAEYDVVLNYLEILVSLPWDDYTQDPTDLSKCEEILNRDHYGLEKIKSRILEFISVRLLQGNKKGTIICFYGPPGVGKTSLGKSIADSLNKKFYRLSLGGVRDEADIRGHRKTYIGAMPGNIINALRRTNTKNPVILLDEIDKLSRDMRGDPSSALLETLDPEQNHAFQDHFINTTFDLSHVFFICTANYLENIQPALRDRLEIIEIPGYTVPDKLSIANKYLIPKQIKETGIKPQHLVINDNIISTIITDFTQESGVRQLERCIAAICRHVARKLIESREKLNDNTKEDFNNLFKPYEITEELLFDILGRRVMDLDLDIRTSQPGVAIGLAYSGNGGAICLIETCMFKGRGEIIITGNIKDIMKESITTGLSWIKSNSDFLGINNIDYSQYNIHVHVPNASVAKDGPSAGITITIALISLIKGMPTRNDTAMTGEISLQGFVLPIGGLKEKSLAAYRNKIKRIIMPIKNKDDLRDLPKDAKENIK